MQQIKKFKIFSKTKTVKQFFPVKILKLKRTKWLRLKKNYYKILKRRRISNYNKIKVKFSSYKKLKKSIKYTLKTKQLIHQVFKESFNFKLFKTLLLKEIKKSNLRINIFVLLFLKIEYKIEVTLWRLFFFSSIAEAKHAVREGSILVNGLEVSQNYFLKQGDFVQVLKKSNKSRIKIISEFKRTSSISSFFEVDYYTKIFVVLKSYNQLSYLDTALCLYEPSDLLEVYRNIKKQ